MHDLARALAAAVEAARAAGALLRAEFHRPGGPRGHDGHAEIDRPAEELIRQQLLAACPWNYRGEELGFTERGDSRFTWVVDPNDGTASFLRGWRGSAVSIAALRDGVPVLGVVYAFGYPDDDGDLFAWADGQPFTRNGVELPPHLSNPGLTESGSVFVSAEADNNSLANLACVRPARFIRLPSIAYRLARVAAGDGIAAVCLSRSTEGPKSWDYAAGHALLRGARSTLKRGASGALVNEQGQEITYTPSGESTCRWCFGGAPAAVRELTQRNWERVFTPTPQPQPPYRLVEPQPGRAIANAGQLARAQGCLLGQFAGDALGGLVEFKSKGAIAESYPHGVRLLADGGTWRNLAGQPTDDSELALMLARTLVHHGRYDPGTVLDAYLHWWPRAWDRGSTISQALGPAGRAGGSTEKLRLVEQNASQTSQANGSLMRISPLGVFGAGRADQAAEWARQDSRLTHPHPVCQDACAVFVAAIATVIETGCTREDCYRAALREAERSPVQPSIRQALESARLGPPPDFSDRMGWVLIALQNAFYQLLHAGNLEEGVVDTVMRGGDTDTNGAIAGALLGAAHGRQALPAQWLHAVLSCRTLPESGTAHPQPCEFWPVDALELAEALLWSGRQRS
ncbi:MAG: ADP-ribosylglycohydrolase family protein [Planctomycetia bacterium]|nr:ADP-ribosylglycohydrolase family protein [Planctomycetia bacterium]